MVQTTCKVAVYNDAVKWQDDKLIVQSHWNRDELVVLEFKGEKITVNAKDLKAAINNCTNTAKF